MQIKNLVKISLCGILFMFNTFSTNYHVGLPYIEILNPL